MEISSRLRENNISQPRVIHNRRYCQSMFLFDNHLSQADYETYSCNAFGASSRCSYYQGSKYHTVYSKSDNKKRRPSIPNLLFLKNKPPLPDEPNSSRSEKEVKGLKIFKSLSLRLSSQKVSFHELQNLFWKKSAKNDILSLQEENNGITEKKFTVKKSTNNYDFKSDGSNNSEKVYYSHAKEFERKLENIQRITLKESELVSLVVKPNYRPIDFTKCSKFYNRNSDSIEDVSERDQIYKEVNLEKGNGKILGFSIVGGTDCSIPIFIKSISGNGEAAKSGKLKEGDQIVKVNGISFTNLSHKDAIKVFKSIKSGEVKILIKRKRIKVRPDAKVMII